ncbi:sigma-54-dependent transcriptional regulator [Vibrio splendidus]
MKNTKYKVLVSDDDVSIITALRVMLKVNQFDVLTATTPNEALAIAKEESPDIALVDLNYQLDTTSGAEGLALIKGLKAIDADIPIVVMTGWGSINIAVEAMQNGATDFIEKPWDNDRLSSIINTQLKLVESQKTQRRLQQENRLLKEQVSKKRPQQLVAQSQVMRDLIETLNVVAQSDANILLTGENGTGKSLFAHYIHDQSSRQQGSMVSVDMSCIPEQLFESEMFGHVKGAFTDAKQHRIGRFELADKGTLFLDEIANTPTSQQSKLLRVLESQQFEKVGGTNTQDVDVRVIAATNANLQMMVEERTFRQDVFYRLNTFEFSIPALRERLDDIIPLAKQFITRFSEKYNKDCGSLSLEAQALLKSYHWPGNIRELSHVVERMVLLGQSHYDRGLLLRVLPEQAIPQKTDVNTPVSTAVHVAPLSDGSDQTFETIEHVILQERLDYYSGNANQAADSLGLSRSAFYRRLNKHKS